MKMELVKGPSQEEEEGEGRGGGRGRGWKGEEDRAWEIGKKKGGGE